MPQHYLSTTNFAGENFTDAKSLAPTTRVMRHAPCAMHDRKSARNLPPAAKTHHLSILVNNKNNRPTKQ